MVRLLIYKIVIDSLGALFLSIVAIPIQPKDVFAATTLITILIIFYKASQPVKLFLNVTPGFISLLFVVQLIVAPLRDNVIDNFINLIAFYLGIFVFGLTANYLCQSKRLYELFLKLFILNWVALLPLRLTTQIVGLDSILANAIASLAVGGRFFLEYEESGHGTALVGASFLAGSLYFIERDNYSHRFLSRKSLIVFIFASLGFLFTIISGTRIGIMYNGVYVVILLLLHLDWRNQSTTNHSLTSRVIVFSLFLLVISSFFLSLYQDEVLEFLENLQANLSNLTGLNIRLVNQEGYGLTSGRDKLWGMHMSMVDEHPFFGIGYPLPLDDYGWADGDAITESGLTSILARYGWIGVVLFFIPALAILWKLIFSSNLGYKPLKIELFIYFAILINCFYNGLLQNPYGEGAFSWTFLLAFYNLLNHTSSRVLQQINATSLNTIPRESLSKSRKQSNRIQ